MTGTIRSLDGKVQDMLHARIKQVVTSIAESAGATADIDIIKQTLITYNDPILTGKMLPTLEESAGKDNVSITPAVMGAEDFSFYQEKFRAILFLEALLKASQYLKQLRIILRFYIDESGFVLGMKTMSNLR
jgi:metal-dependent amidase/aminoacylase/carboxypeptidase family protein